MHHPVKTPGVACVASLMIHVSPSQSCCSEARPGLEVVSTSKGQAILARLREKAREIMSSSWQAGTTQNK